MKDLVATFEKQFAEQNFSAASATLKELQQQNPNDSQIEVLMANLYRATGEPNKAEVIYRTILRTETQAKLLSQARQGLKIIEDAERQQQKDAIAMALAQPGNKSLGFLAIQPMETSDKKAIAEQVARIFHIDTYTAKMLIPSRNLKILRIGTVGELSVYGEQLRQIGIPAIWIGLEAIAKIDVYNVNYFVNNLESAVRGTTPTNGQINSAVLKKQICAVHDDGEISFDWHEVGIKVTGLLPTFGEVVAVDAKHQLIRKEQVLDQVHICDLHLPQRNCILRFHDNHYQFTQGVQLKVEQPLKHIAPTVQQRWASLMQWLDQAMPQVPIKDDFTPFAEIALEFPEFLGELNPRLDLERRKESLWDNCFQLYSGMVFMTKFL